MNQRTKDSGVKINLTVKEYSLSTKLHIKVNFHTERKVAMGCFSTIMETLMLANGPKMNSTDRVNLLIISEMFTMVFGRTENKMAILKKNSNAEQHSVDNTKMAKKFKVNLYTNVDLNTSENSKII